MEKGGREGKATCWPEQRRIKVRTETYLRVLQFGRIEEPPVHQILAGIVSSKTENNTKECKVLELHQCETKGITVQITRLQKL